MRVDRSGLYSKPDSAVPLPNSNRIGTGSFCTPTDVSSPNLILASNGGIFKNKEGLLPIKLHGYYRIIYGTGSSRWVVGGGGEVYYSGDHYGSFSGPW
jgi:ribonuclease